MSFPIINDYSSSGSSFTFARILNFMSKHIPEDVLKFYDHTPLCDSSGNYDAVTISAINQTFYDRDILGTGSTVMNATGSGSPVITEYHYRFGSKIANFKANLTRALTLYYPQYLRYRELELTQISDPLLSEKISRAINKQNSQSKTSEVVDSANGTGRRLVADTTSNTSNGSRTAETEGENSATENGTNSREGENTNSTSGTNTTSNTSNGTDSKTSSGRDVALNSNMPQSNVSSVTAGIPDSIPWTYASTLSENKNSGTENGTSSNTTTGSGSNSSDAEGTFSESGTDSRTLNGTNNTSTSETATNRSDGSYNSTTETEDTSRRTANTSETGTGSGTETENISAQRESSQELLKKALSWVLESNSFKWLADKIDGMAFEPRFSSFNDQDGTTYDPEEPLFKWDIL